MKELEEKILKEGEILSSDVLKVGKFLNQQIDTDFMFKMGEEVKRLFDGVKIDRILTIEASGIAFAMAVAYYIKAPVVFVKKSASANMSGNVYTSEIKSFTHNKVFRATVSCEYIKEGENVLICDDFLAEGNAAEGLIDIVRQAKANVAGLAIAVEKGFQGGGDRLREKGFRVESLAVIDEMEKGNIVFRKA